MNKPIVPRVRKVRMVDYIFVFVNSRLEIDYCPDLGDIVHETDTHWEFLQPRDNEKVTKVYKTPSLLFHTSVAVEREDPIERAAIMKVIRDAQIQAAKDASAA